ncbi:M23 family metallopeptidase [Edaphobacter aggregans]|uniref:M23 family metallopeptidase n=1 Tax=Edaphobacter aggregans TaxID=570835 RepID=UPI000689ED88|nr:M23 family metallopeptidase [Edaphobacter aggregans]
MSLRACLIAVLLALAPLPCLSQQMPSIVWTPASLANGSPCLFAIQAPNASAVTGGWQGHKLSFFRAQNSWYALAGIDIEVAPGNYPLSIEITAANGTTQTLHRDITITAAPYKEVPLSVPEKFVQPDAEALKIIAADKLVKNKAFSSTAPEPLESGHFSPPLPVAPRTDSFGTRRVFNGTLASVHRGLDYRAKPGTPIAAVNSGRVVLARPLYYEGNCVILDHGLGLMTLYMHLSKFKVAEGARVKRGQIIALSGGTGRATGPHLHLGVRWQGAYLDPAKLFSLDLPTPTKP